MTDTPKRPEYRRVADEIRERIRRGDYSPGGTLPKDADLATELETGRGTVEKAMGVLALEGLVTRTKQGTAVSRIPLKITRAVPERYEAAYRERGRGAFDVEVRDRGHEPRWETTVTETDSATLRARHMWADDVPVQIAVTEIPKAVAAASGVTGEDTGSGGMISRLADAGHKQDRITEAIDVRPPTAEEAAFLKLTEDHRVYELTHTAYSEDGTVTEVTTHVMPCHLWKLAYTWSPDAA
ncbi:GntR family transcriptional regulator [Kitasatospora sp. NBC_01287]|uniref:GntR family transcriptional regulator n=1 Tax=Kitasatospora sp. NBC_01287 TaxID=2903573 RepID=UPI0022501CCB|nr:GntR family transcriptional regulator [Kitasatospora sp. NBC_01287]MCX4752014.1 GntR family transcriptional regulator [Kitasatospora sp. NBC_01287]